MIDNLKLTRERQREDTSSVAIDLPEKVKKQIQKLRLPQLGDEPFEPQLVGKRRGAKNDKEMKRAVVQYGPKMGEVGFVDSTGRIWVKNRAHAHVPDHWDVQIDGGKDYIRVRYDGQRF